jgi:hypothetical protein
MWRAGRAETPPGNLHFLLHPWVASNEKVKQTLGWQPRFSSREAFLDAMRAKGLAAPAAVPERPRADAMLAGSPGR